MEKSIHTHLFAALVSTKEHRLAFMATPEQQQFDDAAAAIESAIEDPANLTTALIPKIAKLKVSAIANKDNSRRVEQLNDILNKKLDLEREATETEKKTTDTNADWKKVTEDINSTDATKRDAAIEAGKKLIVDSRARTNELSSGIISLDDLEPRLLAKVTVKAIAAHNKNIEKVQALDSKNEITLVPNPRIGGDEAVKALTKIQDRGKEFLSKDLNDALKAVKDAVGPGAQKLAKAGLDKVVKARREEIYTEINSATGDPTPYVNAEMQVAALLAQLKEMNEEIKAVSPDAPAATPTATPAATPKADPNAPPVDPNAPKKTTIVGTAIDIFNNAVNGVTTMAKDIVKKGSDAFTALQDTLTDKQKSELADKLNAELKKQGVDKHVEINKDGKLEAKDGAPKEPEKAATPPEKEKSQLEKLLAFFKELIDFLRGESVKNGDIGALKSEVQSIDEQIAKIKKENPDFSKKPALMKQIDDLSVKRNELQVKIDQGVKIGSRVVDDANRFINSSPTQLRVRTGLDRQGNPYLMCTQNTPEARGHMNYMTGRLQQIHPGLGFNQQAGVDQRVYFHIHGDVNINSNNKTNNSRTINNTNNVSGRNNTVSASADGSQNGANTQEQIGGVGASQEGTAKNKLKVPTAEPVKPTLSVPVELPPISGSL